jgi:hypothetical protein
MQYLFLAYCTFRDYNVMNTSHREECSKQKEIKTKGEKTKSSFKNKIKTGFASR